MGLPIFEKLILPILSMGTPYLNFLWHQSLFISDNVFELYAADSCEGLKRMRKVDWRALGSVTNVVRKPRVLVDKLFMARYTHPIDF